MQAALEPFFSGQHASASFPMLSQQEIAERAARLAGGACAPASLFNNKLSNGMPALPVPVVAGAHAEKREVVDEEGRHPSAANAANDAVPPTGNAGDALSVKDSTHCMDASTEAAMAAMAPAHGTLLGSTLPVHLSTLRGMLQEACTSAWAGFRCVACAWSAYA